MTMTEKALCISLGIIAACCIVIVAEVLSLVEARKHERALRNDRCAFASVVSE